MFENHAIDENELDAIARQAVSEHLHEGARLTDAVVKAAGLYKRASLTDEHVRRVCEKAYHSTYEQLFRSEGGDDRYVSFDPADPAEVSSRLMAQKVASVQGATLASGGTELLAVATKTASARPRRYVPTNPVQQATPVQEKVAWADARGDAFRLAHRIKDQITSLQQGLAADETYAKISMYDLVEHAKQAAAEGNHIRDILRVCLEGTDLINDGIPVRFSQKVAASLVVAVQRQGVDVSGKVASTPGQINSNHPLALAFEKVARLHHEAEVKRVVIRDFEGKHGQLLSELRRATLR